MDDVYRLPNALLEQIYGRSEPEARWGMILAYFTFCKEPRQCAAAQANGRYNFTFGETDKVWVQRALTLHRDSEYDEGWCANKDGRNHGLVVPGAGGLTRQPQFLPGCVDARTMAAANGAVETQSLLLEYDPQEQPRTASGSKVPSDCSNAKSGRTARQSSYTGSVMTMVCPKRIIDSMVATLNALAVMVGNVEQPVKPEVLGESIKKNTHPHDEQAFK
ncbi:hypothetical protein FN846DRAFT_911834 [Sphaerosporella brunnea]|uniref:Uncharacterized protein n=1 Tax=Sphaerosporella brunnea TaxID=1250544 RepID=A0A5J5EK87_9PEZI|nr:hypothetical protein FN846DRAFT_911834 [Sphaerosporella brunnea]